METIVTLILSAELLPEVASIEAFNEARDEPWCWTLTLRSFEVVHGISRLVRLVPDKLATAIEINREFGNEDGTFLIDLILDLLKQYQDLHFQQRQVAEAHEAHLEEASDAIGHREAADVAAPSPDEVSSLDQNMKTLFQELEKFKDLLTQKNSEGFEPAAIKVVEVCDDLLVFSQIFLDFIHPVWIQVKRSRSVDDDFVEEKKKLVEEKLTRNAKKLSLEFRSLYNL